jgi:hypothetical protein
MRNEYTDALNEISDYSTELQKSLEEYNSATLPEIKEREWDKIYESVYEIVKKGSEICESLQYSSDPIIKKKVKTLRKNLSILELKLEEIGQIEDGSHPKIIEEITKFLDKI